MILHNVSHKRSLSQSMSAAYLPFLWQSICRVVRELKSCHRVILSSQLSGRYCLKKKKELRNVHFLHLVDFTEFRPFYMANTLFQTGEFFKIVLREKTSSPVLQPRFSQVTIKSVFIFRYTEFTIASKLSLPLFHTAQKPSAFEIAFVCLFRNKLFISVKIGFALWSKLVS